jgi:peptidyl-prolyl cis-trans isomerase C
MLIRLKLIVLGLCLTLAGAAACSSTPEVPDQTQAHEYESTEEAAAEDDAAAAAGEEAGAEEAAPGAEIPQATGPVAEINGEPITAEVFNSEIAKIAASGQVPPQLLSQLKGQIINKIVDKTLIDNAVAEADITVSDEKVDARIAEIQAEFARANDKVDGKMGTLDDLVAKLGISEEEFRESVRESLAIEALLVERGMTYPSAEEVKAFYDENQESFKRPEQVHARHILIQVPADADEAAWAAALTEAEEVRAKAVEPGADFAALAAEFSDGPLGKQRGGDLGWFGRGQMVPEFEEAAFTLEKGAISEPVRTQFGWHIIKKVDEREAGIVPFDKIKEQLDTQMRNERVQKALSDLLTELHASQEITLHPENVK